MTISPTSWYGFRAWAVESPALRLLTVPELGAKVVSLVDHRSGREWIVGPGEKPLQPVEYGSSFVAADMSGWDEMFPTINACAYPVPGRYQGVVLPDHGEAWSVPWQVDAVGDEGLTLSVEGRALPYRLSRTLRLASEDTLELGYEVSNTGDEALAALWAAHPQFVVDGETEIVLPPEVHEVVNVTGLDRWAPEGRRYPWPLAKDNTGAEWHLNRIGPASRHDCRKFYAPPEVRVGWAKLVQPNGGGRLRLEWSPEDVPYLGIWIDEGAYSHTRTAALEPTTGYYDGLAQAWQNGRVSQIGPGERASWWLRVQLGTGKGP